MILVVSNSFETSYSFIRGFRQRGSKVIATCPIASAIFHRSTLNRLNEEYCSHLVVAYSVDSRLTTEDTLKHKNVIGLLMGDLRAEEYQIVPIFCSSLTFEQMVQEWGPLGFTHFANIDQRDQISLCINGNCNCLQEIKRPQTA